MNNESTDKNKSLAKTEQNTLSSHAIELLQVFKNMKTYTGKRSDVDWDEKNDKLHHNFGSDTKKILEIYAQNPNDNDVCLVLRNNLYMVHDAMMTYPTHDRINLTSTFIKTLGGMVLNASEISDTNRINVFSGICQLDAHEYNLFTNSSSYNGLDKQLKEKNDHLLERVVCLPHVSHKYNMDLLALSNSRERVSHFEALAALDYARDNFPSPSLKEYVALSCAKSCKDSDFLVYSKAIDLLTNDVYKDNPLAAFTAISSIRPNEKDNSLVLAKYESSIQQLLSDTKKKISEGKKGEAYSPEVLGKTLYKWTSDFSTYGVGYEGRDFAKSILETCKDNKELIKAYNQARIKDKPLGSVRLVFTQKSKLEKY